MLKGGHMTSIYLPPLPLAMHRWTVKSVRGALFEERWDINSPRLQPV